MDDPMLILAILGLIILAGAMMWCVWWALHGARAGPVDENALTTIAAYDQPDKAYLDRSLLESHGIRVFIADDGIVGVDWYLSNALGGVKLQVPFAQVQEARGILADHGAAASSGGDFPPRDGTTGVTPAASRSPIESDGGVVCPRCGSDDVYRMRRHRKWAYASLLVFNFPIPTTGIAYQCDRCGFRWKNRCSRQRVVQREEL